ncbi:MAG TPA: hypothetical protein PKX92_01330 [Edaphocola sp.]|nr:hypothetical protein [Edaphocola sp.]
MHFALQKSLYLIIVFLCFITPNTFGQAFSVQPNEVTAFSENIIYVNIKDWDCDAIQVRTDNGKLKKVAACKYVLIPQRLGVTHITLSKVSNGKVTDIGISTLMAGGKNLSYSNTEKNSYYPNKTVYKPAKNEPTFQVVIAGREGGKIKNRFFSKNNMLTLLSDDAQALKEAKIASWRLIVLNNDIKDWDEFMPSEFLNQEAQLKLFKTQTSKKIIFSEIRIFYKNKFILLPDMEFELN